MAREMTYGFQGAKWRFEFLKDYRLTKVQGNLIFGVTFPGVLESREAFRSSRQSSWVNHNPGVIKTK